MQTNTHELARTYVDHVAMIDQQQAWPTPCDRLNEASQRFGELCVEASKRDGLPHVAEVQAKLGQIISQRRESIAVRNRAELFKVSVGWLTDGSISQSQRYLQYRTAMQLDEYLESVHVRPRKFRGLILGNIGELAIMGAINFMDDPSYLALPALPHHNEHPKHQKSYDIALISGQKPSVQCVQVKFGCQNFCNNPVAAPHKSNKQGSYGHEIALVSGHCDAGMHFDQRIAKGNLHFADALSRSVILPQTVTNDEFELLFHVGDRTIENLTGADLRDRLGKATTVGPRARRKALREQKEIAFRKSRGGTAQDYAYA